MSRPVSSSSQAAVHGPWFTDRGSRAVVQGLRFTDSASRAGRPPPMVFGGGRGREDARPPSHRVLAHCPPRRRGGGSTPSGKRQEDGSWSRVLRRCGSGRPRLRLGGWEPGWGTCRFRRFLTRTKSRLPRSDRRADSRRAEQARRTRSGLDAASERTWQEQPATVRRRRRRHFIGHPWRSRSRRSSRFQRARCCRL